MQECGRELSQQEDIELHDNDASIAPEQPASRQSKTVNDSPLVTKTTAAIEPACTKPRGAKRKLQELSSAVKELRNASEALSQADHDETENEAFAKYVLKSFDKLSPMGAILAQQEIQGVLTKYRLQATQGQHTAPSRPPSSFSAASSSASILYSTTPSESADGYDFLNL